MNELGLMAWPDVTSISDSVLVVPIGSTEQHGPHLPFCTDTDIAVALCNNLAKWRDFIVAPALPYGSSGEHAGFPGTLSIGERALELVVLELCRSATDTFDRVLLVSGHGGNYVGVTRAVETLKSEGRDVLAYFPAWNGDAHAGRTETSIELFLRPEAVVPSRFARGAVESIQELMPALRARGVHAVSPNGVLGDPSGATGAEGAAVIEALTLHLICEVDAWLGKVEVA